MPRKGYGSVTLPTLLLKEAHRVLKGKIGEKYRSMTELVSEALEDKIEALKGVPIVSTKDTSREDAKQMIIDHLRKNPGFHYPSDMAYSLGLDLELVFEITNSLLREQVVEIMGKKEIEAR